MKRLLIALTLSTLILTACGATATEQPASVQEATAIAQIVSTQLAQTASAPMETIPTQVAVTTASTLNTDYTDAVSVAEQLLAGTFLLVDTNLSPTGEQTAQLIQLWTSLKDAVQNSTAQEQTDALVQQIESAMTAEQVKAIADFKVTRESMMAVLQDKGVTMGGPQQNGRGAGAPPQGTPPAGGPGEGGTPPEMSGTPGAGNPPTERGNFIQPELIEALIQFLQDAQG